MAVWRIHHASTAIPLELILLDRKRCRYRRTDRESPSANPIDLRTAICCSYGKIIQAIQTSDITLELCSDSEMFPDVERKTGKSADFRRRRPPFTSQHHDNSSSSAPASSDSISAAGPNGYRISTGCIILKMKCNWERLYGIATLFIKPQTSAASRHREIMIPWLTDYPHAPLRRTPKEACARTPKHQYASPLQYL